MLLNIANIVFQCFKFLFDVDVGIDLGLVKEYLVLRALTAHKNWATLDQAQPMISEPIQKLSGTGPMPPRAISK